VSASPTQIVDRFATLHLLVIGDAMLDSYLHGSSGRLCQEAPVPVVAVGHRDDCPGGAANTAANLRALGARVTLLAVAGVDYEGILLRQALERRSLGTHHLLPAPDRSTLAKHRVVAGGHLLLRFDQGSTVPLDAATEAALLERLRSLFPRMDGVVVSDYGYGVLTPRVLEELAALQARSPRLLAIDSKQLAAYRGVAATLVKPNYTQALELLGGPPPAAGLPRADSLAARAAEVLQATGTRIAAITLDVDGALIAERGRPLYRTYARPASQSRAAGAGDTFLASFALALAAGADTPAAAEVASAAAGLVVGKEGTAVGSADELRMALTRDGGRLLDLSRLAPRVEAYRRQGRRVVFTNGCFDILHRGHVAYLSSARALGDVLVVGVNSDASIRRLKGPDRPINTLEDRLQVLAALSCVDHLVAFEEDTPESVIRALRPDVFVKGGDYTRERLPEAPLVEVLGGVVRILPYLEERSTTQLIHRIRGSSPADAATTREERRADEPERLGERSKPALRSA
jgi:D-beta-D-heptose 7-phosphate kinase/D-beta-D-heptose 1-phosphate adenosyltransferase